MQSDFLSRRPIPRAAGRAAHENPPGERWPDARSLVDAQQIGIETLGSSVPFDFRELKSHDEAPPILESLKPPDPASDHSAIREHDLPLVPYVAFNFALDQRPHRIIFRNRRNEPHSDRQ